jgi:hypothetical protein
MGKEPEKPEKPGAVVDTASSDENVKKMIDYRQIIVDGQRQTVGVRPGRQSLKTRFCFPV